MVSTHSGIGMLTKKNKNQIRWTNVYAERYLKLPTSSSASADDIPLPGLVRGQQDPRLHQSHGSMDSELSFSTAATNLSSSMTSLQFTSNLDVSGGGAEDNHDTLPWLKTTATTKEEAVSERDSILL